MDRRTLLKTTGLISTALCCGQAFGQRQEAGRFTARPVRATEALEPGEHVLADNNGRRTLLYLPPSYQAGTPTPFLLMLHGARGNGDRTLEQERAAADEHGVILLSASSRQGTWDGIRNGFTYDFETLDGHLQTVFNRCSVDTDRMAVGGFSDGASYGISLGLINGDLFTHVIAHSPGFIIANNWHGRPKIYISHGTADTVLPFDRCGKVINERLEREGYNPRFDVFEGGHTASPELRSAALAWLTG
jgi:phospholipase/carboxylesterase